MTTPLSRSAEIARTADSLRLKGGWAVRAVRRPRKQEKQASKQGNDLAADQIRSAASEPAGWGDHLHDAPVLDLRLGPGFGATGERNFRQLRVAVHGCRVC